MPTPPLKDYKGQDIDRLIADLWPADQAPAPSWPQPVTGDGAGDGKAGPLPSVLASPEPAEKEETPLPERETGSAPLADEQVPTTESEGQGPHSVTDASTDETLGEAMRDRVVVMLLFHEVLRQEQIKSAWDRWSRMIPRRTDSFWRFLAEEKGAPADRIFEVAAEVYAFPRAQFTTSAVQVFLKKYETTFSSNGWNEVLQVGLVPIGLEKRRRDDPGRWIFATHDPSHPDIGHVLRKAGIGNYEIRFAPKAELAPLEGHLRFRRNPFLEQVNKDVRHKELDPAPEERNTLIDETALSAQIKSSTLINLFEAMLIEGVRTGASDIHIFPAWDGSVQIHFRIDGELVFWRAERGFHPRAVFAVIKNNASNVDTFERDAAQDGFIQRTIDDVLIRFRISVIPVASRNETERYESIVIRVLDDRKALGDLDQIVVNKEDRDRFEWALHQPQGMIILSGPTGSGKTTTLSAALDRVATSKVNVITIEDPVEYITPNIRQVRINHKLSLENALRFILRHDPDVVMLGEIRDRETADLAIKLANTGHLTLSTVHANDAPSVVSRLFKMGIEPFLIANAINLVVAQRLVRVLCPRCKRREQVDPAWLERLGFTPKEMKQATLFTAGSDSTCDTCRGLGFTGRRAITEALVFSPAIRRIILKATDTVDEEELRRLALLEGMRTLQVAAKEIVMSGDTSFRELLRAVPTEYNPGARTS